MPDDAESFENLVSRLRRGDETAAAMMVREFEPEVRRFVRSRLFTSSIRRLVDSLDVSQSVFARFFVQLEADEIEIPNEGQLRGLLLTMAQNKVRDVARREHAQKRDARRIVTDEFDGVPDRADSPSQQVANAEILTALQNRLSQEERHLVELRMAGTPWETIADEEQSTPEALRKRMSRAIDRAARELGVLQ